MKNLLTMDSESIKIDKLQSIEQWSCWKFQVKIILKANDLWDIVSGATQEEMTEAMFDTELKRHSRNDSKAQKIIVISMGHEPMLHIVNCKYACDMWEKLESVYEQKSKTSIHLLQQRFYSFSKEPEDSMALHISNLEKIVQQLKDLGESVSDSMVITKILMTLPSNYNHFYSAWESTHVENQTLNNLTARLMMEESRMETVRSSECSEALYANKKNSAKQWKKNKAKKTGKCFLCKENGHWKSECPKRLNEKHLNKKKGDAFISETLNSTVIDEDDCWYLDSGASDHMSKRKEWFVNYTKFYEPMPVRIGNGDRIYAYGKGDINIIAYNNNECIMEKHLSNVLYVPEIHLNLFSSSCPLDKGLKLVSDNKQCELKKDNVTVAVGIRDNRLFKLLFKVVQNERVFSNSVVSETDSLKTWHEKLCHQNIISVKKFLRNKNISFKDSKDFFCEACVYGKHHRSVFTSSKSRSENSGDLIHTDVCGPMQTLSIGG